MCVPNRASVVLLICPKMIRLENNCFGELCIKIRQRLTLQHIAKRSDYSDKFREISNVGAKDLSRSEKCNIKPFHRSYSGQKLLVREPAKRILTKGHYLANRKMACNQSRFGRDGNCCFSGPGPLRSSPGRVPEDQSHRSKRNQQKRFGMERRLCGCSCAGYRISLFIRDSVP